MEISDEGTIRDYYDLRKQLRQFSDDIQAVMSHPNHCLSYLQPGRLVHITYKDQDFGWGVAVNYKQRKPPKNSSEVYADNQKYILDVLINIADGPSVATKTFEDLPAGVRPPTENEKTRMEVVPVTLSCLRSISHVRIFLPKDINSKDSRNSVKKALGEVQKRFPDGVAVLDPIENMNIKDEGFKKLLRVRITALVPQKESIHADMRTNHRKWRFSNLVCSRILCIIPPGCPSSTNSIPRRSK